MSDQADQERVDLERSRERHSDALAVRTDGNLVTRGLADIGRLEGEATRRMRVAADPGQAHWQFCIGNNFHTGEGVPQDLGVAVQWYRLAADQGHAGAQFALGVMYSNGSGVSQDAREAVRWLRRAAEQGVADAQFYLGHNYHTGKGVPQDAGEAVRWYGGPPTRVTPARNSVSD